MKLLLFLLSAYTAVVVVVASPHNFHVARRHPVAVRAPVAIPDDSLPLPRRQSTKRRCKNRSSSAGNLSSTPALKASPATKDPTPSPSTIPHANNLNPVPTTTTTKPPVAAPTPTPATTIPQSSNNNLPSFMSGVQTGQGTFYDAGLGACGITNTDSDYIVAVSWRLFDNYPGYNKVNPNSNPICGKRIRATYQGKSVTVTVTDRCADDTCLVGNLDFSRVAFSQLASFDLGRLFGLTWVWA